jgi:hypothetical protein
MNHWTYIAMAYGFTALCIAGELVALGRRRRLAIERARRERDVEPDEESA